jgi:flagellar biosynthesis protein FliP
MFDSGKIMERLHETGAWQNLSPPVQTALFLGAMALLPALLVCVTPFTRIVIVLGFVRRAVTSQEIPPNFVIIGISLFLTLFVMGPTLEEMNKEALNPYLDKTIDDVETVNRVGTILKKFLLRQTRRQDLALFLHIARVETPKEPIDTPFSVVVPAFVISELKTAFIMGFCISLPFLLVDLVVSCMLTSMGMVMMPPVIVSAPFKLLLFVLADGWYLVAHAVSVSFG